MNISFKRHTNASENNRVEYLLPGYDYYDGNDLLSSLFQKEFGMIADNKVDGLYYTLIKLHLEDVEYNLIWHEDIGNYLYSTQQDGEALELLEKRLETILEKVNNLLKDKKIQ